MTIKAEISFMVYGQNGVGICEKRIMEISQQDFSACRSSNRNNNPNLISWTKTLFPNSKKVTISNATQINNDIVTTKEQKITRRVNNNETKINNYKKQKSNSNFSNILLWILFFPYKLMWWMFKNIWKKINN